MKAAWRSMAAMTNQTPTVATTSVRHHWQCHGEHEAQGARIRCGTVHGDCSDRSGHDALLRHGKGRRTVDEQHAKVSWCWFVPWFLLGSGQWHTGHCRHRSPSLCPVERKWLITCWKVNVMNSDLGTTMCFIDLFILYTSEESCRTDVVRTRQLGNRQLFTGTVYYEGTCSFVVLTTNTIC
jgi:hypothetical protein